MALVIIAILFSTHVLCIHNWKDATCDEPRTCATCGRTEGDKLGHDWSEGTCTIHRICQRCGADNGTTADHTWKNATCTEPKTCLECGKTIGKSLGHNIKEWTVDVQPTCTAEGESSGLCLRCNAKVKQAMEKIPHTEGDWVVLEESFINSSGYITPGKKALLCSICASELKTEEYKLDIEITMGQRNALGTAHDYLRVMAFSKEGLIDQLEYEGYSYDEAVFAVSYCGADWYEQAALMAKEYLEVMSFSRSGLISQLQYSGFTYDQAEYGVTAVGY